MIVFLLADGFEELEAVAPIDILRRCGADVRLVSVRSDRKAVGSHGIEFGCDMAAEALNAEEIEMLVLPGGGLGVENLDSFAGLDSLLESCRSRDAWIGAICAAPSLLGKRGYLQKKKAICYPGFEKYLTGAVLSRSSVVRDGRIITAKAAGVAVEFGLELASALYGNDMSKKIGKAIYHE